MSEVALLPQAEIQEEAAQDPTAGRKLVLNQEESLEVWKDYLSGLLPHQIAKKRDLRTSTVIKAINYVYERMVEEIDPEFEHTKLVECARMMTAALTAKIAGTDARILVIDSELLFYEQQGLRNLSEKEMANYLKLLQAQQAEVAKQIKFSTEIRNFIDLLADLTGVKKFRSLPRDDEDGKAPKGLGSGFTPEQLRKMAGKPA